MFDKPIVTTVTKASVKAAATRGLKSLQDYLADLTACIERQKNQPVKYFHGEKVGFWTVDRVKDDLFFAERERKAMNEGKEFKYRYFNYLFWD